MGNPKDTYKAGGHDALGESASAISLHSSTSQSNTVPTEYDAPPTRYFDDDPTGFDTDDLPPLYSDPEHGGTGPSDPLIPSSAAGFQLQPFAKDKATETAYYLDRRLDNDPKFLQEHIRMLSHLPPRPYAHIRGTHRESFKKGDRTETKDVVDFDVEIELTHLLYEDIRTHKAWRHLRTAGNFEKVHRGTVFATRAPGFGGSGIAEEGTPSMEEWAHRYCASHAGLKSFSYERRIQGWDTDLLERKLEKLVRDTNYRGKTQITFPVRNARVEFYNECRTNQWRLTKWIEMLFYFSLMFIFTWPWLKLRTKRWATVYSDWQMSRIDETTGRKRYACMSEERWYNMWARAVQKAVLDRRQGQLDQGDLQRSNGGAGLDERGSLDGIARAGVEAMGVVNMSFGWGGDR